LLSRNSRTTSALISRSLEVEPDPEYLEHLWESGELTETP